LLAARAWKFLKQSSQELIALDLGAGSGCICNLARIESAAPKVHAVEISTTRWRVPVKTPGAARSHRISSRRLLLGDSRRVAI